MADGRDDVFGEDEVQLVRWFADAAALALDNARARAALVQQAQTDSLTTLLNHRAFHDRLRAELQRVRAGNGAVTLLMLDIDNFKRINDVHGHGVGDQVLSRIAGILRAAARVDDHVCRIGGEEFAVIMPAGDTAGALALAHRIAEGIAECDLDPVGKVTVSIGVAEGPRDASSARELAVCADAAMLTAKAGGKNRVVLYEAAAAARPSQNAPFAARGGSPLDRASEDAAEPGRQAQPAERRRADRQGDRRRAADADRLPRLSRLRRRRRAARAGRPTR